MRFPKRPSSPGHGSRLARSASVRGHGLLAISVAALGFWCEQPETVFCVSAACGVIYLALRFRKTRPLAPFLLVVSLLTAETHVSPMLAKTAHGW